MEHAVYKLEKTKIAFKHNRPIDAKLCRLTFNYPKFYVTSHIVQYIWNYSSAINYDIAHSKVVYKYFLKAFYNRTNKKEYDSQIRKHNIRYTNIIVIKDMIAAAKRGRKNGEPLAMENVDKTVMGELAKVSNTIDLGNQYIQAISNGDIDVARDLELTSIKKYWRCAGQI